MTMDYVRRHYGVPAKRGVRVKFHHDGRLGTITSASYQVYVRFDGARFSVPCHPTYMLTYCVEVAR